MSFSQRVSLLWTILMLCISIFAGIAVGKFMYDNAQTSEKETPVCSCTCCNSDS